VHWLQSPRQCTEELVCRYKDIRPDKFPSASSASLPASARSAGILKAWADITTDRLGGVATEDSTERLRRDVTRSRDTWAVTWQEQIRPIIAATRSADITTLSESLLLQALLEHSK